MENYMGLSKLELSKFISALESETQNTLKDLKEKLTNGLISKIEFYESCVKYRDILYDKCVSYSLSESTAKEISNYLINNSNY